MKNTDYTPWRFSPQYIQNDALSFWVITLNKLARLFGENVRKARKSRGISQEDLASLCSFDRSYMGRVERGENRITLEKVYVIAVKLDCEVHELLPGRKTRGLFSESSR